MPSSHADITHPLVESTAMPRDIAQPSDQVETTVCATASMTTVAVVACVYARLSATSSSRDSGPLATPMLVECAGAVDVVAPSVNTSICCRLGSVTHTSLVGAT